MKICIKNRYCYGTTVISLQLCFCIEMWLFLLESEGLHFCHCSRSYSKGCITALFALFTYTHCVFKVPFSVVTELFSVTLLRYNWRTSLVLFFFFFSPISCVYMFCFLNMLFSGSNVKEKKNQIHYCLSCASLGLFFWDWAFSKMH